MKESWHPRVQIDKLFFGGGGFQIYIWEHINCYFLLLH